MIMLLLLVFWNPRGISNKETVFKNFLKDKGAVYAGVSESQTYRSDTELNDARWRWDAGKEGKPSEKGTHPSRGMGAFIDSTRIEASVVRKGTYTLWHRVEMEGEIGPLVVGVGYFPKSTDLEGHRKANEELIEALDTFNSQGEKVVFGGDLNAHIGANGDDGQQDKAGNMMLDTAKRSDMIIVNTMPGMCTGGPTRVQVREDGVQETTIDYVMCSASLTKFIKHMTIEDDQMDSDHRPLVLALTGMSLKDPKPVETREVWDVRDFPDSWVGA